MTKKTYLNINKTIIWIYYNIIPKFGIEQQLSSHLYQSGTDDVDLGIAFQGMSDIVCLFRRLQLQDIVDIAVAVADSDIPAGLRR